MNDTESMSRRVESKFGGENEEEVEIDFGYPVGINSSFEEMEKSGWV